MDTLSRGFAEGPSRLWFWGRIAGDRICLAVAAVLDPGLRLQRRAGPLKVATYEGAAPASGTSRSRVIVVTRRYVCANLTCTRRNVTRFDLCLPRQHREWGGLAQGGGGAELARNPAPPAAGRLAYTYLHMPKIVAASSCPASPNETGPEASAAIPTPWTVVTRSSVPCWFWRTIRSSIRSAAFCQLSHVSGSTLLAALAGLPSGLRL